MTNSDEWTDVIQTVSDRHKKGEITGAEYHGFTEVVDRARSRGWTPEDMGFDPDNFEDDLQKNINEKGLVSYGPTTV